ncbi:hypothetical protein [Enterobacter sp. RHBSTW-01064]|uniref:hypothetical protein n=1 Tax=Enterobacter sp. RHBSTW-01064 TaxID=2742679 RepID=UPI002016EDC9|nr:hypothetical protein [Enterobacter sp. RHBSTW-01064]
MLTGKRRPPYTFGDSKGGGDLSVPASAKAQAWAFIQWVFNNAEHDRSWLELTGMPPARSDLMSNPLFVNYFEEKPAGEGDRILRGRRAAASGHYANHGDSAQHDADAGARSFSTTPIRQPPSINRAGN